MVVDVFFFYDDDNNNEVDEEANADDNIDDADN